MTTDAIDISHWNTVESFDKLRMAGIVGVFHKATEGTTFVDDRYRERMGAAQASDLKWGAYHFLKHGNAGGQMQHFVKTAALPPGSRVAIDYEDTGCTLEDLRSALESLAQLEPTWQIAVYAGGLLKGQVGDKVYTWLMPYPLWLAHYAATPAWPTQIWPHWTLWQYTDQGRVEGMEGDVDLNHFNGSKENCAKWFGPVEQLGQTAPAAEKRIVNVAIDVPPGVGVTVTINGELVVT